MPMMIDWDFVARRLGYPSEPAMWKDLYETQKIPLVKLAQRFDVSHGTIRTALLRAQLPIRTRGGPNRQQDPRWPEPAALLQEIEENGLRRTAERLGFSRSAVYKHAKRLKDERRALAASDDFDCDDF